MEKEQNENTQKEKIISDKDILDNTDVNDTSEKKKNTEPSQEEKIQELSLLQFYMAVVMNMVLELVHFRYIILWVLVLHLKFHYPIKKKIMNM